MNKKRVQKLHQIYRRIPDAGCKGLCASSCTVLGMSVGEAEQLKKVTGRMPSVTKNGKCSYLEDERCTVYEDRPAICRLFGAVNSPQLKCGFGCVDPQKELSDPESMRILHEIDHLGGGLFFNATEEDLERITEKGHGILPKV